MPRPKHPTAPAGERIAVGIIRKPHGVRGEASVEPWTDSSERFEELSKVTLVSPDGALRPATIDSVRLHAGRALLHFTGIDSPEEVGLLRGWTIEIPESEARSLEPDEYFLHELVGLQLIDGTGRERGTIITADEGGSGVLFTIRRADGHEFAVPFAASICTGVDLEHRRMTVELPEGIEDLEGLTAIEDEPAGRATKTPDAMPDTGSTATTDPESDATPVVSAQAKAAALRVDIVTIFPRMFDPLLAEGVIGRAIKSAILEVKVWDLRDFALDKHRSTDDEAYGGGPGMVMMAEPVFRCVEAIQAVNPARKPHVILTSPQGRVFTHSVAGELARREWIVLLCGRYEGFDERVIAALVDEESSIGDVVLSGGELAAMVVLDAVGRLIDGVVGNAGSVEGDSFFNGLLDYPHYTRPEELRGLRIPEILLSGHHEKIRQWRKEQSLRATLTKRPDLLKKADLDREARTILKKIENETR